MRNKKYQVREGTIQELEIVNGLMTLLGGVLSKLGESNHAWYCEKNDYAIGFEGEGNLKRGRLKVREIYISSKKEFERIEESLKDLCSKKGVSIE